MPAKISVRRVVVASCLVNVLDVVTNLVVAWLTGSAVVFAEMAQALADSIAVSAAPCPRCEPIEIAPRRDSTGPTP